MIETPCMLITDDDLAFRETLREVFQPRGFRTVLAGDGEEALSIVEREPVHLILLDMHMPKLTGLETLKRVQTLRAKPPCILLSAGLTEGIIAEAQQAEAYSVLSKPLRFAEITSIVSKAMRATYDWPS